MKRYFLALPLLTIAFTTQSQTISAAISSSVNSTVTGIPTLSPFTSDTHIENGLITEPVNFAVKSNRAWKLVTSISNIVGTPIAGGVENIAAPLQPLNISWGVINGANGTIETWTAFVNASSTTATPIEAKTGSRGGANVTGNTFTLRYKVTPGFEVDPGTYAVSVTHTVSGL